MPRDTFGRRLSNARKSAGMTRTELAAKCCTTERTIYRWERDEFAPQRIFAQRILEVLPDAGPAPYMEQVGAR